MVEVVGTAPTSAMFITKLVYRHSWKTNRYNIKSKNKDSINILNETYEILYAGILSGGFAFVLQIYAQKNINPAPAAIIFSLEGVFATIAAWFILNQILNINNILGCGFILAGVLLSQLMPTIKKT